MYLKTKGCKSRIVCEVRAQTGYSYTTNCPKSGRSLNVPHPSQDHSTGRFSDPPIARWVRRKCRGGGARTERDQDCRIRMPCDRSSHQ